MILQQQIFVQRLSLFYMGRRALQNNTYALPTVEENMQFVVHKKGVIWLTSCPQHSRGRAVLHLTEIDFVDSPRLPMA